MRRTILGLLLVLAAAWLVAVSASPASAVTLRDSGEHIEGHGQVRLGVSGEAGERFTAGLYDEAGNYLGEQVDGVTDGPNILTTIIFDVQLPRGKYLVRFESNLVGVSHGHFVVTPASPVGSIEPKTRKFYPHVADGYLDTFVVAVSMSMPVEAVMDIVTATGGPVTTISGEGEDIDLVWNGRDSHGILMPVGDYVAQTRVVTRDETGELTWRERSNARVILKSDTVAETKRQVRSGKQTSRRVRAGACSYATARSSDALEIGCVGSNRRSTADTYWAFSVPRGSKITDWRIAGQFGCCARGVYVKSIRRSGQRVVLRLLVGGRRSFTVSQVALTVAYQRAR